MLRRETEEHAVSLQPGSRGKAAMPDWQQARRSFES